MTMRENRKGKQENYKGITAKARCFRYPNTSKIISHQLAGSTTATLRACHFHRGLSDAVNAITVLCLSVFVGVFGLTLASELFVGLRKPHVIELA